MRLPVNIKVYFYEFLVGGLPLLAFEKWVYENEAQIELALPDFHFDLISYNYKQYNAEQVIYDLVYYSIIDQADYAQWGVKRLLSAIIRNENWEKAASTLYWEFWDDNARFGFLLQIADYSAVVLYPPERFGLTDLVGIKREKVVSSLIYPQIVKEAESILNSIENKDILITGEKEYIDKRSDAKPSKTFDQILLEVRAMLNDE